MSGMPARHVVTLLQAQVWQREYGVRDGATSAAEEVREVFIVACYRHCFRRQAHAA